MITDEDAEKSANYIRDNAGKHGKSKGDALYLKEFRKSIKAQLMNGIPVESACKMKVSDKENYAYSHPDYIQHLKALQLATEESIRLDAMYKAAALKIEIWRTQSATNRNIDRSHR